MAVCAVAVLWERCRGHRSHDLAGREGEGGGGRCGTGSADLSDGIIWKSAMARLGPEAVYNAPGLPARCNDRPLFGKTREYFLFIPL